MRRSRILRAVLTASMAVGISVIAAGLALAEGGWLSQTAPNSGHVNDVQFQNTAVGFAVGSDGIIATIDGGETWTTRTAASGVDLHGIDFPAGTTAGYVVGDSGTILKTVDGGVNWLVQPTPTADRLYAVDFPSGGTIGYAVGNQGLILKTIDGGATWTLQTPPTSNNLRGVSFPTDALTGYAVGHSTTILKTVDGGANWVAQASPLSKNFEDVIFPIDPNIGFVVGQGGHILRTVDGGMNWLVQTTPTTKDLFGIDFPNSTTFGYAVGNSGTILATVDGGVNWAIELPPDDDDGDLLAVDFTAAFGQGWAVGKSASIIKRSGGSPPALAFIEDQVIDEKAPFSLTATATDPDGAADILSFTMVGIPPAGTNMTAGGVFTWTPSESQGPATYSMTVRVTDSAGFWDEQTFTIQVAEVNVPVVADAIADVVTDELVPVSFLASATDPDVPANLLIWTFVSGPVGAAVSPTGAFSWTPSEVDGPGWYPVTLAVSDGYGSSSVAFRVAVDEVNVAPVPDPVGDVVTDELVALSFGVSASDSDVPVQVLSWSFVSGPPGAAVSPTGEFSWTPSEIDGPGWYPVTLAVSDGKTSADLLFVVTVDEVNVAPVPDPVGDVVTDELVALSFGVTASDSDVPVQVLSWSFVSGPAGAAVSPTGVFSWTPSEIDGPGSHVVTLAVSDGKTSADLLFVVTVDEVNVAPVPDPVGDVVTDELVALSFGVTASDADIPINTLSWSLVSGPVGAAVSPTGAFSWTPAEIDGPGSHVVTLAVSDGKTSADLLFVVTVDEVNVAPVPGPVGDVVTDELVALSFGVTASDADIPINTLSWSLVSGPVGAAVSPTGEFSWTPSEIDGPGWYPVTLAVSDGKTSADLLFVVTVDEVNVAPVPDPVGDVVTDELVALSFGVTASDSDVPVQVLSWSFVSGPAGAAVSPTGVFSWTPSEIDGPGSHVVTLAVSDGKTSSDVSFTIQVDEVNVVPVPDPVGDVVTDELVAVSFVVSASDSDVPVQVLSWSLVSGPTGAAVSPTGVFSWTPLEEDGSGSHNVTLRVSDGVAHSSLSFTIVVNEVNVAPEPEAIENATLSTRLAIEFPVFAVDIDRPRNTLTWEVVLGPAWASVSPDGLVMLTPPEVDAPETHEVTLRVSDGLASSDVTFWVVVEPPLILDTPDAPVVPEEIVGALASSARKDDVVAAVGDFVAAPQLPEDESVVRTLVVMGGVTAAAVQTLGMPFLFLIALGLMVAAFGNISVFPLIGRSKRMTGTVIEYDTEAGYGFVLEDDRSLKVFVSGGLLPRKMPAPTAGERVSFRMLKASRRDFALDVKRLEQ